jgi:hypothetical protein
MFAVMMMRGLTSQHMVLIFLLMGCIYHIFFDRNGGEYVIAMGK